jgi:hypothetical protein
MAAVPPNRADLFDEAIKLAFEIASQGTKDISQFVESIRPPISQVVQQAGQTLDQSQDKQARKMAQLANDLLQNLLDLAVVAKDEFNADEGQRSHNVNQIASLINWFGAVVVEAVNGAVGEGAGHPSRGAVHQISTEVRPGGREVIAYAWVVNRTPNPFHELRVAITHEPGGLHLTPAPEQLSVPPGRRREVRIGVRADRDLAAGPYPALMTVANVATAVIMVNVADGE